MPLVRLLTITWGLHAALPDGLVGLLLLLAVDVGKVADPLLPDRCPRARSPLPPPPPPPISPLFLAAGGDGFFTCVPSSKPPVSSPARTSPLLLLPASLFSEEGISSDLGLPTKPKLAHRLGSDSVTIVCVN